MGTTPMQINVRARTGAGAHLGYGDGASPENFTKMAQILTIKRSGAKQASEKVTNMDSAADVNGIIYQELLGTIADPGVVDCTVNWVPEDLTHQTFLSRFDGKVHDYVIQGPPTAGSSPPTVRFIIAFSALLLDYPDIDVPLDKAMTLTVKLQLVGTWATTYTVAPLF